jgi:hypothetical protein
MVLLVWKINPFTMIIMTSDDGMMWNDAWDQCHIICSPFAFLGLWQ